MQPENSFYNNEIKFSEHQIEEYRKVFDSIDKDRNGSIDIDELREVISALNINISEQDL